MLEKQKKPQCDFESEDKMWFYLKIKSLRHYSYRFIKTLAKRLPGSRGTQPRLTRNEQQQNTYRQHGTKYKSMKIKRKMRYIYLCIKNSNINTVNEGLKGN